MSPEIIQAEFGSRIQIQSIGLRYEVLRKPLGLQFDSPDLAAENEEIHITALDDQFVAGCMILKKTSEKMVKMRQVAVHPQAQSAGIGKAMVEFAENWCRKNGVNEIQLHARQTAVPFYLKQNYEIFGEPFNEVGIPHRAMKKLIL